MRPDDRQPETPEEARDAIFEIWLTELTRQVNIQLSAPEDFVGVSLSDLPDLTYRDWFEDGIDPKDAAQIVMAELESGGWVEDDYLKDEGQGMW